MNSSDNHTNLNSTLEDDELIVEFHPAWIAGQCVFFIIVGCFGVFGNCIALVALATTPKLRNTCTALIGNLCVADLFSSSQLLFFMTPILLMKGFPENIVLCKVVYFLPTTAYSVSLTTLMFIAANRYILITRSRKCYGRCCGSKQVVFHIAIIWAITFVMIVLPVISGTRPVAYDYESQGCVGDTNWLFSTILLSFYVVVPAFVVVPLLYALTICAANASHRRVHVNSNAGTCEQSGAPVQARDDSVVSTVSNSVDHQNDTTQHPRAISKREINLTRVPILIFTVFAVCWTPHLINHICSRFMHVSVYQKNAGSFFIWANSAINPYLYAWSNRNFRQAYKRILSNLKSNCKKRL